ncbi:MAG: hypothetical protein AAFP84_04335 [Actinomycetota bacterium]
MSALTAPPSALLCRECGIANADDALFCADCGVALSVGHLPHPGLAALVAAADGAPPRPTAHEEAVTATRPADAHVANPRGPDVDHLATSSDRRWTRGIAITAFGLLAIGATAIAWLATNAAQSDRTTTTEPAPAEAVAIVDDDDTSDVSDPAEDVSDPGNQLTEIAAADLERALDLRERWVPQVSGKREGTGWEGTTYDLAAILALHQQLAAETDEAVLLVEGSTLAFLLDGERMAGWWFTLVDADFDDAAGANGWCVEAGFDRSNCAARLVTDRDDATGTLVLRPA